MAYAPLGKEVANIGMADVPALGAAYLAGLQAGVFSSSESLAGLHKQGRVYPPAAGDRLAGFYEGWKKAVGEGK